MDFTGMDGLTELAVDLQETFQLWDNKMET